MLDDVRINRSRREFLRNSLAGFGSLAFGYTAYKEAFPAMDSPALGSYQLKARAKAVIFLFMAGGPSHVETFDPKPLLNRLDGKPRPQEFGKASYQFVDGKAPLLGVKSSFRRYGKSGIEVSDLFPHVGQMVDDLAVMRSCHGDMAVHSAAQNQLFSGRIVPGFPSIGSWITAGSRSGSESLPASLLLPQPGRAAEAGKPHYPASFAPAVYQPAMLGQDGALYEAAFRPQDGAEALDVSDEPAETLELYGVGRDFTDDYGRRCLLARRLVEKGARFVCVVSGGRESAGWDAHSGIDQNHRRMAAQTDQPTAALLKDLKRRGMLDETLVVWGGEFGRSPQAQTNHRDHHQAAGRDHHNLAFSMWMAGGGVQGGRVIGATDEIGFKPVDNPIHFRDLHATMLYAMGVDPHCLSDAPKGGRNRAVQPKGRVIEELFA